MASANRLPLGAMARMAWRNLWRNHRRTLIMLLAITVGVWAMIFMTALMRGMVDQMIEDGIDALPGLVQIHHPDYRDDPSVENSLEPPNQVLLQALESPPSTGWTTRIRVPAMISSERDSRGVTLLGVDPAGEIVLGFDPGSIVEGRFLEGTDDNGLVIGRKLLERLETDLGKRIVVMSQDTGNEIADRGFRIVGVYKGKLAALEENYIYAGRSTVQSLLKMDARVSEIAITGRNYRNADPLLRQVRTAAGGDLDVKAWTELDTYLGLMLGVMDGFVLVWVIVIFLALSFGLVNTLMMAVFERVREFGLMQALGMKPSAIRYQVLLESVLLLLLGLLAGNLLAVASILPIRDGIDLTVVAEGMEMMGVSSVLYPSLYLNDIVLANVVVVLLGILTSLLPAWRASQYRPVEAIAKT
ncbi:MAG: ABC transporter permease [Xanthomonadales bacterium]|nr:ABC transporter permease [Gammaproteobacteria bacterium]NND56027.1 ABC transporter permease [Xanthomonadales bacterium]NNK50318.1 ABC transporter permease [Xanthomonadales bacterium]